jgi:hypothetical protein
LLSGFIVLRGVVNDPMQGGVIAALVGIGWMVFRWKYRKEIMTAVEVPMGSPNL